MNIIFQEINHAFEITDEVINVLVIENQGMFFRLLTDIYNQVQGRDGKTVLSEKSSPIPISKHIEILDRYIPFELNNRPLLSKIAGTIEKRATGGEEYYEAKSLLSEIEKFLDRISFDFSCNLDFSEITLGALIKASGMKIREDYESLGEAILDYMELVREFMGNRLFVTVNLRDFLDDGDTEKLMQGILAHGHKCFMIECHEHKRLVYENRYIIDADLCEIY